VDVTLDGEIRTHTPVFVRAATQQVRVLVSPQAKSLLTRDAQG
jgi:diacylglycerol kinase family enzyme